METQEIQAKQQAELHTQLWSMANDLRGNMDASEFKNYILGLIFYRYLSDKLLRFVNDELEEDGITYEEAWNNEDFKDDIIELLVDNEGGLGYIIEPNNLWSTLINKIKLQIHSFKIRISRIFINSNITLLIALVNIEC